MGTPRRGGVGSQDGEQQGLNHVHTYLVPGTALGLSAHALSDPHKGHLDSI